MGLTISEATEQADRIVAETLAFLANRAELPPEALPSFDGAMGGILQVKLHTLLRDIWAGQQGYGGLNPKVNVRDHIPADVEDAEQLPLPIGIDISLTTSSAA